MKKLSAILLTSLFLFNLFGYKMVFNHMQRQSDVALEAALDHADYNEAELITIQVPLSVPYQNNQVDFERVDGEITFEGKIYKYVKRKITDGNLVLMCLPDHNKMRLQSAKDEFFKYANDLVQSNTSKKSDHSKTLQVKNAFNEFYGVYAIHITAHTAAVSTFNKLLQLNHLPTLPRISPEQPPEIG